MIAAVIVTFAAVFLAILALYFAVTAARHSTEALVKRRLRGMAADKDKRATKALSDELLREIPPAEQILFSLPLLRTVRRLIEQSGVRIKPLDFVLFNLITPVAGFLVLFVLRGKMLTSLLAAAVILVVPVFYLQYHKQKRQTLFTEQLPEVLTMLARSLRAGHSLTSAVELVSEEMPAPAGELFKIAFEQQKLGLRMADSLATLQEKIHSMDLNFFVTIIKINTEIGGSLAEILEKLAETIRSRLQIRRQVEVYTAEGRLSGYVLVALPAVVFGIFYVMRPGSMDVFFTDPICRLTLVAACVAQLIGFLMIRKIVRIRI